MTALAISETLTLLRFYTLRLSRVMRAILATTRKHLPWLAGIFAVCLVIPGPFDELGCGLVLALFIAFKPALRSELRANVKTAWGV